MEKIYQIELRISTSHAITPLFSAVQGDTGTRKIEASILNDDGTVFENETGITAEYWSKKPDGNGTQHSATITASSSAFKVGVTLSEQDLAAPGRVYAAIVLKKSDTILASMPFWFTVVPIPVGENIDSTSDYELITEAVEAATQAAELAQEAAEHQPIISPNNGHWLIWDASEGEYVDTGIPAAGAEGVVLYSASQSLTTQQKAQARSNIGAAGTDTATTSADGLMSATDKGKLDGIDTGANAYTHPAYTSRTGKPTADQTPAFGDTFTVSQIESDGTGHVTGATDRTVKIPDTEASSSAKGLMSSTDKSNLDTLHTDAIRKTAQTLTDAEKGQARTNIGAASSADLDTVAGDIAQAYDSTATYAVGDYCIHDNVLYKCSTAISTAEAWTAAHWTAVVVMDEVSDLEAKVDANAVLAKVYIVTTPAFTSLPYTYPASGTDNNITTDMVCIKGDLSVPSAQGSDWTVNTDTAGKATISGTFSGSTGTTLTMYLMKSR